MGLLVLALVVVSTADGFSRRAFQRAQRYEYHQHEIRHALYLSALSGDRTEDVFSLTHICNTLDPRESKRVLHLTSARSSVFRSLVCERLWRLSDPPA